MKKYGAVIVFDDNTTRKEAEEVLARLAANLDSGYPVTVETFDPEMGAPYWTGTWRWVGSP